VALVRKRNIPTERPPFVGEDNANFCRYRVSRGRCSGSPRPLISIFYTRSHYFSIQVAPQLYSRGWVDPVPDPLLLRKSGSAGNRTRDLCICSQELWPLDHRGGPRSPTVCEKWLRNWIRGQGPQWAGTAIEKEMVKYSWPLLHIICTFIPALIRKQLLLE
jgi:hypothetical protein